MFINFSIQDHKYRHEHLGRPHEEEGNLNSEPFVRFGSNFAQRLI